MATLLDWLGATALGCSQIPGSLEIRLTEGKGRPTQARIELVDARDRPSSPTTPSPSRPSALGAAAAGLGDSGPRSGYGPCVKPLRGRPRRGGSPRAPL